MNPENLTQLSVEPLILQGHPINSLSYNNLIEHLIEPRILSSTVGLPEELVDPVIMGKLTKLNHLLINIRHDFFHGVVQHAYIRSLQEELDQAPARFLREKLDFLYFRELGNFSNSYTEWYKTTYGVPYPGNFKEEYADKCYQWYLKAMTAPSPLDQFEIVPLIPMNIEDFYFSFTNPSLFMLLTLTFFLLMIRFVTKRITCRNCRNSKMLIHLVHGQGSIK